MKVIPLTDEQAAEFARLTQALRDARQQQNDAWQRALEADKKLSAAIEAMGAGASLSEDGKYLITYGEYSLWNSTSSPSRPPRSKDPGLYLPTFRCRLFGCKPCVDDDAFVCQWCSKVLGLVAEGWPPMAKPVPPPPPPPPAPDTFRRPG